MRSATANWLALRDRALNSQRLATGLIRFVLTHPGLRGARLAALGRVTRWQVAKHRSGVRAAVQVGPTRMMCYPGATGSTGVLYAGLPEWSEMVFALRFLRSGDYLVDVGANVGTYSMLATTWVPGTIVTAFEPDTEAADRFEENRALNHVQSVQLIRAAVGAKSGMVHFTTGLDTKNHIATGSERPNGVAVRSVALDDAIERQPALLKVDVEGDEYAAFLGARRLLTTGPRPAALFELNKTRGTRVPELLGYLEALGYSICWFDPAAGRLQDLGWRERSLQDIPNAIAVPDMESAQQRVTTSRLSATLTPPIRVTMKLRRRRHL